jgi:hypothetical protein
MVDTNSRSDSTRRGQWTTRATSLSCRPKLSKTPTDHGRRPPGPNDGCLRRLPAAASGCLPTQRWVSGNLLIVEDTHRSPHAVKDTHLSKTPTDHGRRCRRHPPITALSKTPTDHGRRCRRHPPITARCRRHPPVEDTQRSRPSSPRAKLSKTPTDHGRRPPGPKDGCLRRLRRYWAKRASVGPAALLHAEGALAGIVGIDKRFVVMNNTSVDTVCLIGPRAEWTCIATRAVSRCARRVIMHRNASRLPVCVSGTGA